MSGRKRWKRPRVEYRRENFLRPPTSFKGGWEDESGRKYVLGARGDGKNWGFVGSASMPENAIIGYVRIRGEQAWVAEGETVVLRLAEDIVRYINGRAVYLKRDEVEKRAYTVYKLFVGDAKKKSRALVLEPTKR